MQERPAILTLFFFYCLIIPCSSAADYIDTKSADQTAKNFGQYVGKRWSLRGNSIAFEKHINDHKEIFNKDVDKQIEWEMVFKSLSVKPKTKKVHVSIQSSGIITYNKETLYVHMNVGNVYKTEKTTSSTKDKVTTELVLDNLPIFETLAPKDKVIVKGTVSHVISRSETQADGSIWIILKDFDLKKK